MTKEGQNIEYKQRLRDECMRIEIQLKERKDYRYGV